MEIIYNLMSFFMYIMIITSIILVYKKKLKFTEGIFLSALSIILVYLSKIFIYNRIYSTDLIGGFINNAIDVLQNVLQTAYTQSENTLPAIDITQIKNMYTLYFPSLIIIYSVVISFVVHMSAKLVLKILKKDVSHYPVFSDFRFPKSSLLILALTYLFSGFISNAAVSGALNNINILLIFLACFCGFSFIDFKLKKKVKKSILRFLIYMVFFMFFGFFTSFLMMVCMFAAIADSLFNIRKNNEEVNNE